jgi:hypothetical protein
VDFEVWHEEEKKYLEECANEPEVTTVAVEYVELLQKLHFAEYVFSPSRISPNICFRVTYGSMTSVPFLTYTLTNYSTNSGLNTIARECTNAMSAEYSSALRKYQLQLNTVSNFENIHGISPCWTLDDLEYKALLAYVQHCQFIHAVDELEGLVV